MARSDQAATDLETAFAKAVGGERVIVRRGNKRVAVVPVTDLARLEDLDDAAEARAALAEQAATGAELLSAAEVHRRLGLPG